MLVLGMACRKLKLLTKSGIDNMKLLVTNIMLPVAIFHALATADYSVKTWKLVGIMFVMLVVSFGVGFLLCHHADLQFQRADLRRGETRPPPECHRHEHPD